MVFGVEAVAKAVECRRVPLDPVPGDGVGRRADCAVATKSIIVTRRPAACCARDGRRWPASWQCIPRLELAEVIRAVAAAAASTPTSRRRRNRRPLTERELTSCASGRTAMCGRHSVYLAPGTVLLPRGQPNSAWPPAASDVAWEEGWIWGRNAGH